MVDPISDMLTRLRNALAVKHLIVKMPYSMLKHQLAQVMLKENLIKSVNLQGRKNKKEMEIELLYEDNQSVINGLKRISRPGQRVYKKNDELKPIKQGYGLAIVSTSKGLMTDREARKQKIGGEVLCEIY